MYIFNILWCKITLDVKPPTVTGEELSAFLISSLCGFFCPVYYGFFYHCLLFASLFALTLFHSDCSLFCVLQPPVGPASYPMAPPSPGTNSSTNHSSSSSTAGWEQLSKTNLYIRGLLPTTTDHDLAKLCQPWVPPYIDQKLRLNTVRRPLLRVPKYINKLKFTQKYKLAETVLTLRPFKM